MLTEEFQVHDQLNQKIFEGNHLRKEVRETILKIVSEFEKTISVPIEIVDVQLCGSNCSYNYTEHSDLDVHLIANFESVSQDISILQALYNAKKAEFNREYDVTIRHIPVEIYIQDIKSSVVSNGVYSVYDDKWIKEPKPIKSVSVQNTEKEVAKWQSRILSALGEHDVDEIQHLLNNIYLVRHNSILADGEYSKGNQIFKDLRSAGLIAKMKDALVAERSKQLSLESMSAGRIINRMDY